MVVLEANGQYHIYLDNTWLVNPRQYLLNETSSIWTFDIKLCLNHEFQINFTFHSLTGSLSDATGHLNCTLLESSKDLLQSILTASSRRKKMYNITLKSALDGKLSIPIRKNRMCKRRYQIKLSGNTAKGPIWTFSSKSLLRRVHRSYHGQNDCAKSDCTKTDCAVGSCSNYASASLAQQYEQMVCYLSCNES